MKKFKAILPLLLILYIVLDTVLKINNIELCSSTGCKLAGDLLKFNSLYLNYLGVVGATVLLILALIKTDKLYAIVATSMVAFESLLIASQLNINPEVCKFCLGVYTFLLLILLVANRKVFLYMLPIIASIFVAFSMLNIPKNKTMIKNDGLYLIASKTCPHCKKTKAFLNSKGVKYTALKAEDANSYFFAKSLNINKIPIAIKKNGDSYKITVGDKNIMELYGTKKQKVESKEPTKIESSSQNEFQPKLNLSGEDEGCSYSPTATPESCESEDGNTTAN